MGVFGNLFGSKEKEEKRAKIMHENSKKKEKNKTTHSTANFMQI